MSQNQEFADFEIEDLGLEGTKPMEGGSYQIVAEGSYIVEVVNVDNDTSDTAKPYIEVEFIIAEGQETEEAAAFTGQHLWNRYYLTQKAKGRLVQLMNACRAPLDKFRASAIYGAKLRLDVVHNQGEQKTDDQGNPMPIRTFANVCKERPFEDEAQAEPPPPPPPAAKAVAATKAATTPAATTPPPAAQNGKKATGQTARRA